MANNGRAGQQERASYNRGTKRGKQCDFHKPSRYYGQYRKREPDIKFERIALNSRTAMQKSKIAVRYNGSVVAMAPDLYQPYGKPDHEKQDRYFG